MMKHAKAIRERDELTALGEPFKDIPRTSLDALLLKACTILNGLFATPPSRVSGLREHLSHYQSVVTEAAQAVEQLQEIQKRYRECKERIERRRQEHAASCGKVVRYTFGYLS